MLRQVLVLALCAVMALGHQELSELYKAYKASGSKVATKSTYRDLKVALANTGDIKADKDLFAPPHPHQSTVDYHPIRKTLPKDDEPIIYYSWHVHLYFFHEDVNVTNRMLDVRSAFLKRFPVQTCDDSCFMGGWMDNCTQGMCTWDPIYGVDGPHPYGQWATYLPNEYMLEALAWFSLNHGEFEIFFHPNTGYMVGDHDPDKRAIWIKKQVPLDLNFLIWLQCEWFGCSLKEELEAVKF